VDDNTVLGTDAGPFILAGLPGINMGQDSPEYKYTHHSAVDTFDKIKGARRTDPYGNQFRFRARINVTVGQQIDSTSGPMVYDVFLLSQ